MMSFILIGLALFFFFFGRWNDIHQIHTHLSR